MEIRLQWLSVMTLPRDVLRIMEEFLLNLWRNIRLKVWRATWVLLVRWIRMHLYQCRIRPRMYSVPRGLRNGAMNLRLNHSHTLVIICWQAKTVLPGVETTCSTLYIRRRFVMCSMAKRVHTMMWQTYIGIFVTIIWWSDLMVRLRLMWRGITFRETELRLTQV